MYLVVGLGNPGARYVATRHNVGFRVAVTLAASCGIVLSEGRYSGLFGQGALAGRDLGVLLPQTFMNRSGESVAAALGRYPDVEISRHLVVVVDDLDIDFGRLRVRLGGSSGGHRGLESLIRELESDAFTRVRFGVGRPEPHLDPTDYVLQRFDAQEENQMPFAIERAARAVGAVVSDGAESAMSRFNGPWPESSESTNSSGQADFGENGDLN